MKRSMIAVGAEETLLDLIDEITMSLEELQDEEFEVRLGVYGEGSEAGCVEILEFIRERWEDSERNGLDFDMEAKFPI